MADPIKDPKNPGSGPPTNDASSAPADGGGTPSVQDPPVDDPDVEIRDGFVKIPEKTYNSLKDDMHKYKKERNESRGQVDDLTKRVSDNEAEKKKKDEEKLLEDEKFKELAEKREQENIDLQTKLNATKIDNALKVEALKEGINDIDGLKLADLSKISIDPDTGKITGIKEVVENLKKEKSYLFETSAGPPVDTGKAGTIPKEKISKKDLLYNGTLAQQMKKDDPDRYQRIIKDGSG